MSLNILQFGSGNFLRAFFDWVLHIVGKNCQVSNEVYLLVNSSISDCEILKEQDNAFHLVLEGQKNGERIQNIEKIRVFRQYGRSTIDHLQEAAKISSISLVVSNTTEAGIAVSENDTLYDPRSFPAKLLTFLYYRYDFIIKNNIKQDKIMILPCELVQYNGNKLKNLIQELIQKYKLSKAFINWLSNYVIFYNTLVDRIVTGFPSDKIREYDELIGFRDKKLVHAEWYHLLAVSGETEQLESFLPLKQAGLNVIYTNDIQNYWDQKIKILNGLHCAMVSLGLMLGCSTVKECMEHTEIKIFLLKMLGEEIIDQVNLPRHEVEKYAQEVLERFENPYIIHKLSDIFLNCSAKINIRLFPTISSYITKNIRMPHCLIFVLVLYIFLYSGKTIEYKEDTELVKFYTDIWSEKNNGGSTSDLVTSFFLENPAWQDSEQAQKLFKNELFISEAQRIFTKIEHTSVLELLKEYE